MSENEGKRRFFYSVSPEENKKWWSMDRAQRGAKFTGTVGGVLVAGQYVYLMAETGVTPERVPFIVAGYAITTGVAAGMGAVIDGFKPTSRFVGNKKGWPEIQLAEAVMHKIKRRRSK